MKGNENEMEGRVCLVTGGTSGIGRAAALGLARRGATVALVARDEARGQAVCEAIRSATGNDRISALPCDLSSQAQVRSLARAVRERYARLHVLLHSAGALFFDRRITPDGVEANFAVTYLSLFLLEQELEPVLRASAPARVVVVSGEYHRKVAIDWDDLMLAQSYGGIRAGSQAALAKVMFTLELARRLEGSGVTANCLHPGAVRTGLTRGLPWYLRALAALARPFFASPERGAATPLYLCCSPEVEESTGGYYIDCRAVEPSAAARDPLLGRRLWERSESLLAPSSPVT